jgi:hypothetical protein
MPGRRFSKRPSPRYLLALNRNTWLRSVPVSKWQIPPPDPADVSVARLRELGSVTERRIRDQHVVSRVILKGFAAPGHGGKGWQLTPFDVRLGREGKPRGLKVCGRVPDFLLCASESAERLWGEVENRLGPAIKAARDGHLHEHDSHVSAIRDGIALHLVRSLRYVEINHGAVGQAIEHVRRTAPSARRALLEAEFQRRHGLVPAGPEALVTLLEGTFTQWRSLSEKGVIARAGVEAMFRRVSDALRLQEVEVWHVPRGHELLISDSPAIAFRYSSDHTRIEADVAVGDASGIALPLAQDCLAVIGPEPKDVELLPGSVELFNRLQVEGARRYVYYHPSGRLKAFVQAASPPAA